MIRALFKKDDGTTVVLLGVDDENIRRLTSGKPIQVKSGSVDPEYKDEIIIVHGSTMEQIEEWLKKAGIIGPSTKRDDRR